MVFLDLAWQMDSVEMLFRVTEKICVGSGFSDFNFVILNEAKLLLSTVCYPRTWDP